MRSRDYDDEQWALYRDRLIRRGLLDDDDELTAAGRELKQRIEDTTDALALGCARRARRRRGRDALPELDADHPEGGGRR